MTTPSNLVWTALRLTGRDVLPLLHRTTSNALVELALGSARASILCDFKGRVQHRFVLAVAADGAVWALRPDAPGAELAAAIDRMVFRDHVQIEDRTSTLRVTLVAGTRDEVSATFTDDGVPLRVSTGDGTALVVTAIDADPPVALSELDRIAMLHPRHGHELVDAFNPFELGLAHEVHLAKGCFTGQEALQRLITYESVRRRPAHVRLSGAPDKLPCEVIANGAPAGILTSVSDHDGIAILSRDALANSLALTLANGVTLQVLEAPELARPQGR